MKQQINLYQPESVAEADKIILSLDNLVVWSVIFIVFLAGIYGFEYGKVWLLEDDINSLENQVAEREKTIDEIKGKVLVKGEDKSLDGLKKELELKRESFSKLRDIHQSGSAGFSQYFESLSKNIIDGVWLKEFSIHNGGEDFEFKGQAIDGPLVMVFLEGLSKDAFFKNKNFSTLEVNSGEEDTTNVSFVVNSGGKY